MNTNDLVLKVENVRKEYVLGTVTGNTLKEAIRAKRSGTHADDRRFIALDDVSFSLHRGETVGLIGSNGAGKSTLLKLISRITAPTQGQIHVCGRVASMLEVGTGFHPELTGRENIYLNGSILGMSKKEIDEKIESIIAFSECAAFMDTPVKRYSSGMYVKLAFAVAAHLDAEIMIMDEVLAVGDVQFQRKCLQKMREVATGEQRTILYVSHNMDTIRALCRRCIVLDHGKILFDGDTEEAIRLYEGGNIRTQTQMNLAEYIRPGWLSRDDVRLIWAEFPDRTDDILQENSMEILLRWKLQKDVENMGIRVELCQQSSHAFATKVFYNVFSGKAGECGESRFTVPLTGVMNGRYSTYYTVFELNSFHEGIDLDCVRGLEFQVERKGSNLPMRWRSEAWGNIQL